MVASSPGRADDEHGPGGAALRVAARAAGGVGGPVGAAHLAQHGGVRGAVRPAHHHGQRQAHLHRQPAAPQAQVRRDGLTRKAEGCFRKRI